MIPNSYPLLSLLPDLYSLYNPVPYWCFLSHFPGTQSALAFEWTDPMTTLSSDRKEAILQITTPQIKKQVEFLGAVEY